MQRCAIPHSWVRSRDCFSIAGPFRVSELLWHCSKWACQFIFGILQYTSVLELLACNINNDLNCHETSSDSFRFCEKWIYNKPIYGLLSSQNQRFSNPPGPCPRCLWGWRVCWESQLSQSPSAFNTPFF